MGTGEWLLERQVQGADHHRSGGARWKAEAGLGGQSQQGRCAGDELRMILESPGTHQASLGDWWQPLTSGRMEPCPEPGVWQAHV